MIKTFVGDLVDLIPELEYFVIRLPWCQLNELFHSLFFYLLAILKRKCYCISVRCCVNPADFLAFFKLTGQIVSILVNRQTLAMIFLTIFTIMLVTLQNNFVLDNHFDCSSIGTA
jgi:hypothetical protein